MRLNRPTPPLRYRRRGPRFDASSGRRGAPEYPGGRHLLPVPESFDASKPLRPITGRADNAGIATTILLRKGNRPLLDLLRERC